MGMGVLRHCKQYFKYNVCVSFFFMEETKLPEGNHMPGTDKFYQVHLTTDENQSSIDSMGSF